MRSIILVSLLLALFSAPFVIYAADSGSPVFATTPVAGASANAPANTPSNTTSISGDDLCGSSKDAKCTLSNLKTMLNRLLAAFVLIGSTVLAVMVLYRLVMAWFAYRSGNSNAIKEAGKKSFSAVIGFIIVFVVFGGLYFALLKMLGVNDGALKLLQSLSSALVPHAYAASGGFLPNPLIVDNLYDLILSVAKVALQFFIYPALIVMWVWSGFQYIYAQGRPTEITKAHNWLLWAVIITVVAFTLQGFLYALRGTVQNISPQNAALIQRQN